MAYTAVNKSTTYFNTKLYTGDGASPRSITGVGFQPDFLWIKNRSGGTSYEHRLMDAVRGSNKVLHTSTNGAENSEEYYTVSSFDSDGWTGRNGTGSNQSVIGGNDNGYTFAAWNWKAGGGQGSSNTDGSINTTYTSANTTAGFSISSYTGTGSNATVGHGLGVAPKLVIIKDRDNAISWVVGSTIMGWNKNMYLNSTAAQQTANHFQDTAPTNSLMYLSTDAAVNGSGNDYIMYCFAEKSGYSKIGKYTSNNSSNGAFVYTGFKPKFIMIKNINGVNDWRIYDSERAGYNNKNYYLRPNGNGTEITTDSGSNWDMLSNGFKFYTSESGINGGVGNEYLYYAVGQSLVGSNNIPCTAR